MHHACNLIYNVMQACILHISVLFKKQFDRIKMEKRKENKELAKVKIESFLCVLT